MSELLQMAVHTTRAFFIRVFLKETKMHSSTFFNLRPHIYIIHWIKICRVLL